MNENHHTYEPHTESASDHYCGQCGGYHDWRAGCAEDADPEAELIDFDLIADQQELRVVVDGETYQTITAWRVPIDASEAQITEAMHYWISATYCQHEHDCCGNYYARPPKLIGRSLPGDTAIVFVLQTFILNV